MATPADADVVARLLHEFNTEYDTPSPGPAVLAARLRGLLAEDDTAAILAGDPPDAFALVTFRPNVWFDGPVALLDELYVAPQRRGQGIGSTIIATLMELARDRQVGLIEINVDEGDVDTQRFYHRHGFSSIEPDTGERAFYFHQELS